MSRSSSRAPASPVSSTAFELMRQAPGERRRHGARARPRAPGGNLRTERVDGYLCEWGPNGFLDNVPETLALVRDLRPERPPAARATTARAAGSSTAAGACTSCRAARSGSRRAVCCRSAAGCGCSGSRSPRARPDGDETIHAFAARRIGREAADVLIDSMVSGVFGGNARELSLRACFPKMWEMETEHGGLVKAMLAKRRDGGRRRRARPWAPRAGTSPRLRGGIEESGARPRPARSARACRPRAPSAACALGRPGAPRGGCVDLDDGRSLDADAVVLAGSASMSATLVDGFDAGLARVLREIPTAPLAVICLGYETARLDTPARRLRLSRAARRGHRHPRRALGFQHLRGRAPAGRSLIRVMIGGAHDPAAITLDDEALIGLARADLQTTMRPQHRARVHAGVPSSRRHSPVHRGAPRPSLVNRASARRPSRAVPRRQQLSRRVDQRLRRGCRPARRPCAARPWPRW